MAIHAIETPGDSSLLDSLREHIEIDEFAQEILNHIIPDRASCSQSQNLRQDHTKFSWHDGLFFQQNLLNVLDSPSQLQILQQCHGTIMVGHFGIHKTFELISRQYWWLRLRHFVTDYVRSCDTCCR